MIGRFCLYGFLKNQRYFEPFLVLILLSRGLTFVDIGALIAVREVSVNLLELFSGALADTWGRRRSMLLSLTSYVASFVIFALAEDVLLLGVAMALYGVGDAFRSGTHKAMILTWLRLEGRADERTAVYGHTRSWSKIGSAVGVVVGAGWVLWTGNLGALFWLALVPYALGLINIATYPAALDGERVGTFSPASALAHLRETARAVARSRPLKGLLLESSAFMGTYKSSKDYLQPVLQAIAAAGALAWFGLAPGLEPIKETALLIGPVYVALFVWSAFMSRHVKTLLAKARTEDVAANWIWRAFAATFALLLVASVFGLQAGLVFGFVALHALEALWRPVLLSRFDAHGSDHQGATLLSVESQARSLVTMLLAPALGLAVDLVVGYGDAPPWWPIGLWGFAVGAFFVARGLVVGRVAEK